VADEWQMANRSHSYRGDAHDPFDVQSALEEDLAASTAGSRRERKP